MVNSKSPRWYIQACGLWTAMKSLSKILLSDLFWALAIPIIQSQFYQCHCLNCHLTFSYQCNQGYILATIILLVTNMSWLIDRNSIRVSLIHRILLYQLFIVLFRNRKDNNNFWNNHRFIVDFRFWWYWKLTWGIDLLYLKWDLHLGWLSCQAHYHLLPCQNVLLYQGFWQQVHNK